MIRAIIVDDEAHIRDNLKTMILSMFNEEVEIIAEANSVKKGIEVIEEYQPDLLFLDIGLRDGTGFDILKKVNSLRANIIFITGYNTHAIKAIKAGALDYILKPVEKDELRNAIVKAIENYKAQIPMEKRFEVTKEYYEDVKDKRIILNTSESIQVIFEKDIIYCESEGNYTTFYTTDFQKIMVTKYMKQIEELLSETTFIRCHRSHIVNKNHIIKFKKSGSFVLANQYEVPISRERKRDALKKAFS